MTITATEILHKAGPEIRSALEAAAGRNGVPLLEVVDAVADKPIGETGKLILEWPIIAAATGAPISLARTSVRVNLTRSLRERVTDMNAGTFTFRGHVGVSALGVPEQPFEVTFDLREFESGQPVTRTFPPLLVRQEPTQIIVNVPEQAAPTVNVYVEETAPVPEKIAFERNPNGTIKSATIQPALF